MRENLIQRYISIELSYYVRIILKVREGNKIEIYLTIYIFQSK